MAHTVTEGLSSDIQQLLPLEGGQDREDTFEDFYFRNRLFGGGHRRDELPESAPEVYLDAALSGQEGNEFPNVCDEMVQVTDSVGDMAFGFARRLVAG